MKLNSSLVILGFLSLLVMSSCATIRANWYLYQVTTEEDKAALLFQEGERLYKEEFIGEKNLEILPKVIRYMSDAYAVDPSLDEANQYIIEINEYKAELYNTHMETIRNYSTLEAPEESDIYQLVMAIKQSSELNMGDKELKQFIKLYKDLIPEVVIQMELELIELEDGIINKATYQELMDPVKLYKIKSRELIDLDRGNFVAAESLKSVDHHIEKLISDSLLETERLKGAKEFISAELIVREAAFLYKSYYREDSKEIDGAKYSLFMDWGRYLLGRGQLQIARNITKLAYDLKKSEESNQLIKEIDKQIRSRSFESTIDDILVSIDYYIEKEDPSSAIKLVNSNLKKFKNSENRAKLNRKKELIDSVIERLYDEAVVMYRDEDYSEALKKLEIVYNYNSNYKQVKDYYNRTETKVKALSGIY